MDTETTQPGGETPAPADAVTPAPSAEPAAQPAETEADTGAAEPDEEAPPDAGAEPEPRKQSKGFQKRIDELTARQREAERDRDHWREMAMRGAPQQPAGKQMPATPPPLPPDLVEAIGPPPNPWDFEQYPLGENDPKFIRAITKHEIRAEQAQAAAHHRAAQAEHASVAYVTTVASKIEAAAERLPGLSIEAVRGLSNILPREHCNIVAEGIAEGPEGADLAHYLIQNPSETRRIAALNPARAAFALGEVRARIKDARKAASATNAPEPPKTVAAARAHATRSVYDKDLPYDEYVKLRRQGKA